MAYSIGNLDPCLGQAENVTGLNRLIGFPTCSLLIIGSPNCNRQKPALKLKKTTYYHKMNDNKNDSTIAGSMNTC
jgi:hypothetical protein